MDYKHMHALYDWLQKNCLGKSAQLLYYTLMLINNKCGWSEWFQRTNRSICGLIGFDEKTLQSARNELKQKGLIDFNPGKKKGDVTKYKILPLYTGIIPAYSPVQTPAESPAYSPVETPDINNINNINKEERKKEGKNKSSPTYQKIIDSFTQDEKLIEAIWGYIQMRIAKRAKPTDRALELVLKNLTLMAAGDIQVQIDILNQSTMNNWTDIYPLKDKGAAKELAAAKDNEKPKGRTFNNFNGRSYDTKDLKQRLLAKSRGELNAGSHD
ncbi:helix-turn-helix domain-containing protein [Lutispora sp.]|uniref:helix-turn-helix domain-containing protein n=1 Tax=Lutispora sp. TaxID=2828727 RepID=UPI002B1FE578|nr:helix-turn-helix domain-containing protein [Lutispora sp.]MEA4963986.1 helix-turn-helix domain-containing protein [Lutispora sp.]